MDLIDRLLGISARIPKQLEHLQTEEATKTALVMPFINALGYDVFDPTSVVPEYTADVGTKKGEKVDYVILDEGGDPIILIECKAAGVDLGRAHGSQLYRYFSVTKARFGVLTNGITYKFFSDLEEPNKMDSRPFLEFSMLEVTPGIAKELRKFEKGTFDLDEILSTASELKYTKGMMKVLAEEWAAPSEELVRLLTGRVYAGRMTQAVREQFTAIAKTALAGYLNAQVNERLKSALERDSGAETPPVGSDAKEDEGPDDGIVTTEAEWRGYYAVKAILGGLVDAQRVTIRDRKRYCAILLDDTNRKPICRLYFNASQKSVGLYDAEKNETKHPIEDVDGLLQFTDQIRATVVAYDEPGARSTPSEQGKAPQ